SRARRPVVGGDRVPHPRHPVDGHPTEPRAAMGGGAVRDGETTSVFYDAPGPRARRRNRLVGGAGALIVGLGLAYVVLRFEQSGQFSGAKWSIFEYENVQRTILDGYL